VIVVSYLGRSRIDGVMSALAAQTTSADYEVILIASGEDDCGDYVRLNYPHVRVWSSGSRLGPGAARNQGVAEARGDVVAFLPDDGLPRPDWVEQRLRMHRKGYDAVGGAIINALPQSYVARAAHMLEYSALLPYQALLEAQEVPHCLSFSRRVFQLAGQYPEDTITGEDTLFTIRCQELGYSFAFSAEIQMGHSGLTSLRANLGHAFWHGRGLMRCSLGHGLGSVIGMPRTRRSALWRCVVLYPAKGLTAKLRRLWRYAPDQLPEYALTLPVVWLCLAATGGGALQEWRARSTTA
jgi:glycosyltransferase involved in cell wall biosynthesis